MEGRGENDNKGKKIKGKEEWKKERRKSRGKGKKGVKITSVRI